MIGKWPSAAAAAAVSAAERISLCVGCGSEIYDQYILRVSPDLEWHASCLKCADCQQYLDESCTCFVRDGKTYCKRDYLRLFGAKCAKCSMCFSKTDLVMRARNKIYHVECFRCAVCARQLTRGDEFVLKFDDLFCKPQQPSMPLHPAGIIPGPGGDLNGHMNSSNISPSGGAGAPTHLSALSGGNGKFDFPKISSQLNK
ncbi:insulin gene enhancer protein ISL-1-like protein [Euroglyphus maynei]|uniref:Insulin gene enhancer protein ISL-1-like protein n=1 Tax=Euroglyphus maynei TaxID=6958 RepID=A0A1Y3AZD7_EURMA|nr:insulin gene enhancer protein ISL-1-like protein [Euroglyphus maynei]